MKAEIDIDIILKLLEKQSSKKIIFNSLKVFKVSKKKYKNQICIYLISLMVAIFVGISYETKSIMVDSIQTMLDIMLGLFGIVFTGYAFFQALINRELLIRMVTTITEKNNTNMKSMLQETNESFVGCMMLNLLAVIVSMLLKVIVSSISDDFLLFENLSTNNTVAALFISIYFYFILIIVWEVKSFILKLRT